MHPTDREEFFRVSSEFFQVSNDFFLVSSEILGPENIMSKTKKETVGQGSLSPRREMYQLNFALFNK